MHSKRIFTIKIFCLICFLTTLFSQSNSIIPKKDLPILFNSTQEIINLVFIDPGTAAFSGYRWRDVAGNLYSASYRDNYGYNNTDVQVQVTFNQLDSILHGELLASELKPNFAYQLKLVGIPNTASNELIGLAGRWWQEEWDDGEWKNGQNLNNKGDGSSPNPNDIVYFQRRDLPDPTSPTGKQYRFTGYLLFDYFITDENGDATLQFEANSSFHVLWNTLQRTPGGGDGPQKSVTFDPNPTQTAYDVDYSESTITIFGEWERLPTGGIFLQPGEYDCQIIITEESFHGWPGGLYTGNWASAMGANIQFTIAEDIPLPIQLSSFTGEAGDCCVILNWVTESEVNNVGFEVIRSSSKEGNFLEISSYLNNSNLVSLGNSNIRQEYFFIDTQVISGQSYWYKLIDVDINGIKTLHGPISVFLPSEGKEIESTSFIIPEEFALFQNYPNPFNPSTTIDFDLPKTSQVSLKIFNILGEEVATLVSDRLTAGNYSYNWDASRSAGMASGIYLYRLQAGDFVETRKMVLMR